MPVDNQIYDRDADGWWSDDSHLTLLAGIVPARLQHLERAWVEQLGESIAGATLLDIGCGGGLFAEALAKAGYQVTGIDPSRGSIEAARAHAAAQGLALTYHVASGERLPLPDTSFDIACCCDVLEHVDDVDAVVAEATRVLRPGGLLLYDTVNRTFLSKWVMVRLLQDWSWLRVAPPGLHAWEQFITPAELEATLRRHHLEPRACTGLAPEMGPAATLKRFFDIRKLKRGEITHADLGRSMVFRETRSKALNYMGFAVKAAGG